MNTPPARRAAAPLAGGPIGPGRLVLVVGPSGAGKDTLIAGTRALCASNRGIVFPRRVVTRPSSDAERHDSLDDAEFDAATARGDFAFWWRAHGLSYGIPQSIDDDISAGRTVVCNVSRGVVPQLRSRYASVEAVLVTAPAALLATRLAVRARGSDGAAAARLKRNEEYAQFAAEHVIENAGMPADGIAALHAILMRAD